MPRRAATLQDSPVKGLSKVPACGLQTRFAVNPLRHAGMPGSVLAVPSPLCTAICQFCTVGDALDGGCLFQLHKLGARHKFSKLCAMSQQ